MTELSHTTKETVSLHTISGRNRVCIDVINGISPLRSVVQPGEQIPLGAGSAAKVLLAHMAPGELSPLLTALARSTKRPKAELATELNRVRDAGFAVSHGERLLGVSAVSAPIKDVSEQVHYCLSVNGPSVRMQSHEKDYAKLVVKAAASISRLYGAQTPV
jgi:DNA-binding IclR family transcriptional regulator